MIKTWNMVVKVNCSNTSELLMRWRGRVKDNIKNVDGDIILESSV